MREERLVRSWARQHALTEPLAVTNDNLLAALGIAGVPAIAIVSDGQVVSVAAQGASADEIAAQLARSR